MVGYPPIVNTDFNYHGNSILLMEIIYESSIASKKSMDGLLIQKNLILLRNEKISIDIIVSYPYYGRNE